MACSWFPFGAARHAKRDGLPAVSIVSNSSRALIYFYMCVCVRFGRMRNGGRNFFFMFILSLLLILLLFILLLLFPLPLECTPSHMTI